MIYFRVENINKFNKSNQGLQQAGRHSFIIFQLIKCSCLHLYILERKELIYTYWEKEKQQVLWNYQILRYVLLSYMLGKINTNHGLKLSSFEFMVVQLKTKSNSSYLKPLIECYVGLLNYIFSQLRGCILGTNIAGAGCKGSFYSFIIRVEI